MMSYTCGTIWPMRIDLSSLECRQILREKELLCYSDVVSVLRAQGPLSEEKKNVLSNLQKILSISDERNKAEIRRAANNEKLATIAESVSGFDAYTEWASLGALRFPPTERPTPRTIYCDQASQTSITCTIKEKDFPSPIETHDMDIAEKLEASILTNRIINKDRRPVKTEASVKSLCSTLTMTDANKAPSQDLFKSNQAKEPSTSHDYNLHLLSEIATGESNQSELAIDPIVEANIKPDSFSIHNQINDIEQIVTQMEPNSSVITSRQTVASSLLIPPSNVMISGPIKSLNTNIQEINSVSLAANNVPMVISNNAVQRYVLPRSSISQGINLITTNQQKNQVTSFISQQPQSGGFLALSNNHLRSPPSHQLSASWTGQPVQQPQQVYIQNVSSHHGLNLQQNVSHQSGDYTNSFGYALKQRAITIAEQHKSNQQINNKLVVRNLGSQAATDNERNKRYMVLKGSSGGGSMGPSTKKPKISNPSNRQPGRPPLMPAPSSAYTSRPYVANEIFHSNRAINTISSISDTTTTDSNGLKISSISSGSRGISVNTAQVRSNPYYPVNRGNGLPRTNASNSAVVQLGSGAQIRTIDTTTNVATNALRPKNIQPVISVVPLSPRGLTTTDSVVSSNVSILSNSNKDDISDHNVMEKDTNTSFKIISKDEVYANIMDRINLPSMVSLSQTENKIQ